MTHVDWLHYSKTLHYSAPAKASALLGFCAAGCPPNFLLLLSSTAVTDFARVLCCSFFDPVLPVT
jgi:hypothetical protein